MCLTVGSTNRKDTTGKKSGGFPTHEHSDVVHPFGITIFPAHLNTHLESADVRKWSELSNLSMQ